MLSGSSNLADLIGLVRPTDFALAVLLIVVLLVQEAAVKDRTIDVVLPRRSKATRWAFYTIVSLAILWFGVFTQNDFIYFQF